MWFRRFARLLGGVGMVLLLALAAAYAIGRGWLGSPISSGSPGAERVPPPEVVERSARMTDAASAVGAPETSRILFGDLHVHSAFSLDALATSLLAGGDGPYSVADACDFARHCSALDFWSINDHAMNLTPRRWRETIDAVRQCDARGAGDAPPDLVSFLGWEWTQMGTHPGNHYGHKNVILRRLDEASIPTRPIAADFPNNPFVLPPTLALGALTLVGGVSRASLDAPASFREMSEVPRCPDGVPVGELPDDCREYAATPAELFAKLDDWGFASLVIPHGTTWGNYTPPGSSFALQLRNGNHDPARQRLVEVFSGHGNAEEHRAYRGARLEAAAGESVAACPEPSRSHLPSCWQAGEIIRARCLAEDQSQAECESRARDARRHYLEAPGATGHLAIGGSELAEWLDSGQCRDCFLPAFNHRPGSSVQAMLAARESKAPDRFRFGIIGSSDIHTSRAGSGYKEVARLDMTDARLALVSIPLLSGDPPASRASAVELEGRSATERAEIDRLGSFFYTGGLAAVHARERSREAIWDALMRREVYGTSGPKILLWFDLIGATDEIVAPMGGEHATGEAPRFRVRAVGSFEQQPGCPNYAVRGLGPQQLARLCRGECANPSDQRRPISRIEVVRIRPRTSRAESLDALIEDPWQVLPCSGHARGCVVEFDDPDFPLAQRDSVYYVRAIEAPSPTINAGGLRCETSESGECLEPHPCVGVPDGDDCLMDSEPRAWSSPIFVDWIGG